MMRLMTGAFGNGEWRTWVLAFDHPDQRSLNSFAKGMTGQHRRHGLTHLRADQAGPDSAWDGGHLGRWPSHASTQSRRPLGARKGARQTGGSGQWVEPPPSPLATRRKQRPGRGENACV